MNTRNSKTILLLGFVTLLFTASSGLTQPIQAFPMVDTSWRYNEFFNLDGDSWWLPEYDDSGAEWKSGNAILSNDSGQAALAPLIRTPIKSPQTAGEAGAVQHTYYFRKKFNYDGPPVVPHTLMTFTFRIDDGASFWLNGTELRRHNLAAGDILFNTQASALANQGNGDAITNEFFSLDASTVGLIQGENTVVVTVHQNGGNSSDIAFGLAIDIVPPRTPTIVSNSEPADRTILQNRSTTLNVYADASPAPTYQWFYRANLGDIPTPIDGATDPSYTIASMQSANHGYYHATVSNPLGSVDSRAAFVQYTEDTVSPLLIGAIGSGTFDTITVQFNEALDPTTALDSFNWVVFDPDQNVLSIQDPGGIALSTDGSVVTLILASGTLLQQDALYTVSVQGIADLSTVNVLEPTDFVFRSFVAGCSGFLFETYGPLPDNNNNIDQTLKAHPSFPDNPREPAVRIASFDSRHGYADNTHEGFGARVRGLFVPNVSAPWVFYLRSDDSSELYVNTSGPDSAGKQRIAFETGCCGNFMPQGDPRTSVPINLMAGQAYYIEAIYKEGTGGDWLKVAARPASEPVPVGGADTSINPEVIQGGAGPAGILNHVTIAANPANITRNAGEVADFSVQLSSDVPACYQWQRDGVDILGAVGPNHRFTATPADDQTTFSVVVSLMGGTVRTSSAATLTVIEDTTGPTLLSASTDPYATNIVVVFNEPIDPGTGQDTFNYQVDAGAATITQAAVSGSNVTLTVSAPLAGCVSHTVQVSGVLDIYNNMVTPSPSTVSFLTPLLLIPLDAVHVWRYRDNGENLGSSWRDTGFDDSAWSQGPGVLAFESTALAAPIRTTLTDPRTLPTAGSAAYFRSHFNLATDPSTLTSLRIRYLTDDGMVVFINGTEVHRIAVPAAESFDTFATRTVGDATVFEGPFEIPSSALVFGDNVIAASVHQVNAGSSDLVFGLEMTAVASACTGPLPRLSISQSGNTVTITSTDPGGTIYRAAGVDGSWTPVGPAPQTLTIGTGPEFFTIRP